MQFEEHARPTNRILPAEEAEGMAWAALTGNGQRDGGWEYEVVTGTEEDPAEQWAIIRPPCYHDADACGWFVMPPSENCEGWSMRGGEDGKDHNDLEFFTTQREALLALNDLSNNTPKLEQATATVLAVMKAADVSDGSGPSARAFLNGTAVQLPGGPASSLLKITTGFDDGSGA